MYGIHREVLHYLIMKNAVVYMRIWNNALLSNGAIKFGKILLFVTGILKKVTKFFVTVVETRLSVHRQETGPYSQHLLRICVACNNT